MGSVAAPLTGHIDVALTNFSKGYRQNELIADVLAPRVPVAKQSGKYWIFGQEDKELTEQTLRAPGAVPQESRMSLSSDSYFCDSHALQDVLPAETEANYEAGNMEQDTTGQLQGKILLDREVALAAKLTSTAVLTQNVTLAGGDQFSDYANSDPGGVVETAIAKIVLEAGVKPNVMAMGDPVFRILRNHPVIKKQFAYSQRDKLSEQDLATFFGIERVIVGSAVKRAAGANSFVWGKDIVIAYANPSAAEKDISLAKTFVWSGAPMTIGGYGVMVFPHPMQSAKAKIVSVDFYYGQKVVAVEGGYLIKAAVA